MNIVEFLRQYRIGGFSIFDFAVAYGGFFLLSPIIIKIFQKIHVNMALAKENSVHCVKKRGQSGRKSGAENRSGLIQICLIRFWAKVKRWRTSQIEKVLSARRRLVTGLRKR